MMTVVASGLAVQPHPVPPAHRSLGVCQARAAMLDRLADQQLQAGFHHHAERLAHAAAEMRTLAAGGRAKP